MLNPGALELPFLRNAELLKCTTDPQTWAEGIHHTIPVRTCEPLRLNQPFRNHTAITTVGEVRLVAVQGSAIRVTIDDHQAAQVVLPYRGSGTWRVDGKPLTNPVGESVLYLPPAPLSLENDVTSGVGINIPPEQLYRTALAMAGPDGVGVGCDIPAVLQQPKRLLLSSPSRRALIEHLYRTLICVDASQASAPMALRLLRFDDLISRLVILLLLPALHCDTGNGHGQNPTTRQRQVLEDLTAWMDANLSQPIGLSDLEEKACYSRRSLQYQFRAHYGCTPMQWLRQRRLDRAMQRLQQPQPGDSIRSIAMDCGYTDLSAFSRDFLKTHQTRPSHILRRSLMERTGGLYS